MTAAPRRAALVGELEVTMTPTAPVSQTVAAIVAAVQAAQSSFLAGGPTHLQPLTHRQVAEVVGVHESTVSRAAATEVETPFGTFPLSYFFQSSIRSEGGAVGSEAVRSLIAGLIGCEDRNRPFSDQALVGVIWDRFGIDIARRTVAKYREGLGFPPASERRSKDWLED